MISAVASAGALQLISASVDGTPLDAASIEEIRGELATR